MTSPSKIFSGYRALGFVSNHVPLAVRYHQKHKENYVVTCVGKAFHTYNCSHLGIVSVSDRHEEDINVLAVERDLTFTACGNRVQAFTRGKQVVHTYDGHQSDVHLLLPFGQHLITVDTNSTVIIWDIKSEGQYSEITFDNASFQVTCVVHPSTYLNKVLFGSKQGELQLWNIKVNKLVYTFPGWGENVTVLQQSPAVDVVAVGLSNGQVILHNIKFDETVTKFLQDWGPITSIAFRTDGHPIMATGSAVGHIALWDLEERKLHSQMRDVHTTAVTGMHCLPNEPLMVTSSADNSLKMWIFDLPDGGGRLLRERSGHSAPIVKLRHYDHKGQHILSAGQDSLLRSFSTMHEKHNKSLGRASYKKHISKKNSLKYDEHRMPHIVQFVAEPSRESDWDNIVACHRGVCQVTTWSYQRSTMGHHKLQHKRFRHEQTRYQHTTAQCVEITSCGNFVLIGYSSGHVDQYNLQSGIHRGSYGEHTAHECCVQGLAVDGLNQMTITAGRNGEVKFWRFKKKTLLDTCMLPSTLSSILLHRDSGMLAVGGDDFTISVIDIVTRKVVRQFAGHDNRITDMGYSSDGRWLVTAGMDCTVKVWDLPSGRLIDCWLVDSAVTSLTVSPTCDFLVTSHLDDVGVYLWANKTLFSHVSLTALPADYTPRIMQLPGSGRNTEDSTVESMDDSTAEEEFIGAEFKSAEQISHELITLSLLPTSRWHNLLNLDVIKERNKPKQPPKVPKAAPFFLPTVAGLEPKFALPEENKEKPKVNVLAAGSLMPLCTLGQLLQKAESSEDYDPVLLFLKSLSPSSIDVEIRSLAPELGGSIDCLRQFIHFTIAMLNTNKNFEVLQAHMGLFLKVHGDSLSSHPEMVPLLKELAEKQSQCWSVINTRANQTLCLVNYLRTAVL